MTIPRKCFGLWVLFGPTGLECHDPPVRIILLFSQAQIKTWAEFETDGVDKMMSLLEKPGKHADDTVEIITSLSAAAIDVSNHPVAMQDHGVVFVACALTPQLLFPI